MSPSRMLPYDVTLTPSHKGWDTCTDLTSQKSVMSHCLTWKLDDANAMDFCLLLGTLRLHP